MKFIVPLIFLVVSVSTKPIYDGDDDDVTFYMPRHQFVQPVVYRHPVLPVVETSHPVVPYSSPVAVPSPVIANPSFRTEDHSVNAVVSSVHHRTPVTPLHTPTYYARSDVEVVPSYNRPYIHTQNFYYDD